MVLIGVLAYLGWVMSWRPLVSVSSDYFPIAPGAALSFVLLGGTVSANIVWPASKTVRYASSVLMLVLFLLLSYLIFEYLADTQSSIEYSLFKTNDKFLGISTVRMSPLAGTGFILCVLATMSFLVPMKYGKLIKVAVFSAFLAATLGAFTILGYIYNAPLLYGGDVRPMALLAALSFVLLDVSIILSAGPDYWPLSTMVGDATASRLLRAFLPLTIGIILLLGFIETYSLSTWIPDNPALSIGSTAIFAIIIFSFIIGRISKSIGGSIDRAERKRQEAEENLRTLFDSSSDAIFINDPDGNLIDVNTTASDMLGYSKDQILSSDMSDIVDPALAGVLRSGKEKLSKNSSAVFESKFRSKDGTGFPVEISTKRIEFGGSMVILNTARDISERKKAEAFETSFGRMLETSISEIYIFDADTLRFLLVNRGARENLGYDMNELYRMTPLDLKPEFTTESFLRLLEPLRSGERETVLISTYHQRKNGTSYDVEVHIQLSDYELKPAFIAFILDITEQKKTERALIESEKKYRSLFESMNEGFAFHRILTDSENRPVDSVFLEVNDSFERFTGLSREDILNKRATEVFPDIQDAQPDLIKIYDKVALTGGEKKFEIYFQPLDKWFSISIYSPQPGYFVSILTDISERIAAEQAQKQLIDALAASNAELQQFAYVASHDLQEPLRMVASYVQLLEKRYGKILDSDARDYIWFAADGASRMQTLINDLLEFSRVETQGKPFMPVDSNHILKTALANLEAAISDNGARVTSDPLPDVHADASQLTQVFQNLISNSLKFHNKETPPQIHVSAQQTVGEWLFSVADDGLGIDSRYSEHIFTIFKRLHGREEYPGTGIGLSICKRIVERHGGRIWFESTPGRGSTFFFTLPTQGNER